MNDIAVQTPIEPARNRPISLDDRLRAARLHPSGFDYLRVVLSLGIICAHSCDISYGAAAAARFWNTPLVGFMQLGLPAFFVISGFLVAGSLERCRTLISFLGLRAIRIYPALAVEVILSALVIGPLVTALPLHSYFADHDFARYLFNVTGDVSYALPGVFLDNPLPGIVNLQLWTIPWELVSYIVLAGLALAGIRKYRIIAPLAVLAALLADAIMLHAKGEFHATLLVFHDTPSGGKLAAFFLIGVSGYLYRRSIPYSAWLFWLSLLGCLVMFYCVPGAQYLTLVPAAYATLYLGLINPRRIGIVRLARYSYGIYLYGWVLQQFVAAVLPWSHQWYLNFALALPLSILAGMASWYFVEKPAQGLRPYFRAIEESWLTRRHRWQKEPVEAGVAERV